MRRGAMRGFSAFEWALVALIISAAVGGVALLGRLAVHRSRDASCASNLRQLAEAVVIYAVDYDSFGPSARQHLGMLVSYTRNLQTFRCPAARRDGQYMGSRCDYLFRLGIKLDDPASELVVVDDRPDRHCWRSWIGARLDSAIRQAPRDRYPVVRPTVRLPVWEKPEEPLRPLEPWMPPASVPPRRGVTGPPFTGPMAPMPPKPPN